MKALPLIAILVLGLTIGYVWYVQEMPKNTQEEVETPESGAPDPTEKWETYQNTAYSISFKYPDNYVVRDREVGNGERSHFTITLMDRKAVENIPEAGEGPTAITFDIFQNNLDKLSAENWIRNTSESNFKLSDGALHLTYIGGAEGLYYAWDGLYQGLSIVVPHGGDILMVSVTYDSPDDQIFEDFNYLVDSVDFQ